MINQEIEKLIEEFEKLKKKSEYSTGNGTWHISSKIVRNFLYFALHQVAEETAEAMVVDRKHEGQLDPILLLEKSQSLKDALIEQAGWNSAQQKQLEIKKELLKEL